MYNGSGVGPAGASTWRAALATDPQPGADQEARPGATASRTSVKGAVSCPSSDGRPMAETDLHRNEMFDLITTLEDHFAADPNIYVSGNILVFYEEGNRRKHVAPDALVVRGISKLPPREYYLLW